MTGRSPGQRSDPDPGLCAGCAHSRRIETRSWSVFRLCQRSASDPRYARYPVLPVVRCAGFELAARRGPAPD
jgi:hypothetical protein